MEAIRRLIARMLLCTDKAIEAAHATADETDSSAGATETFRKVTVELKREFARHVSFTDKAKKKSCAKACLEAYLHNKVFRKVQMLLHYADGQAVVVASAASSYATRCVVLFTHGLWLDVGRFAGLSVPKTLHQGYPLPQSKQTWLGRSVFLGVDDMLLIRGDLPFC